ncbi:hypothetical protein OC846_004440 [Tilletia horrida]|uniref:Uncharacterized protein n=1 Tax=Tilletia horrida TaxID=155126 RepID=A0AAN6GNM9_9BASI|nr:hypothetical protein OC846_004440 [Tilletia horrida]KAK0563670.1 hypothetical protein OC861_004691 [Tilletia horrida]
MELDQPSPPASERVWHTPELVRLILPHLVRERIAVSRVNMAFRAMALPLLVRILDIPLSRLGAYQTLFAHHPELDEHVRFVRIVDDKAVTLFRHDYAEVQLLEPIVRTQGGSSSNQRRLTGSPLASQVRCDKTATQWLLLKDFIRGRWAGARSDITCGVSSVSGFSQALRRLNLKQNIVAMRWVVDHDELEEADGDEEIREARYLAQWTKVSRVIRDTIRAQHGHNVRLASLQIEDRQGTELTNAVRLEEGFEFDLCEPSPVGDFLLQHGHKLVELELPRFVTASGLPAAIRPGLILPNLRILRAPPRVVAALVDGQCVPQLAQVELLFTECYRELMLGEWVLPGSEAAHSMTCLEVQFTDSLVDLLRELFFHTAFYAERFPSLVELSLVGEFERGDINCREDDSRFNFLYLREVFKLLEPLRSLRALRISGCGHRPFPMGDDIEILADQAPRKLEYLTCHSPRFNHTAYFQVLHEPSQDTDIETEPEGRLKMQRLPASFRAHISDEGEWTQSCNLRRNNTIFDHRASPPRLPFQS